MYIEENTTTTASVAHEKKSVEMMRLTRMPGKYDIL